MKFQFLLAGFLVLFQVEPALAQDGAPRLAAGNSFTVIDSKTNQKLTLQRNDFPDPLKLVKQDGARYLIRTKEKGDVWMSRMSLDLSSASATPCIPMKGTETLAKRGSSGARSCAQ